MSGHKAYKCNCKQLIFFKFVCLCIYISSHAFSCTPTLLWELHRKALVCFAGGSSVCLRLHFGVGVCASRRGATAARPGSIL